MICPKIQTHYNIMFNNTGVDWVQLQPIIVEYLERQVLHCITTRFHEDLETPTQCTSEDVKIKIYYRVNIETLSIDVVAVKAEDESSTTPKVGNLKDEPNH